MNREEIQEVAGITIYPPEYFCPQNYVTGEMTVTENTHSIHHYTASWHSRLDKIIFNIERCKNREGYEYKLRRICSFPFRVINKMNKLGLKKTVRFAVGKVWKI